MMNVEINTAQSIDTVLVNDKINPLISNISLSELSSEVNDAFIKSKKDIVVKPIDNQELKIKWYSIVSNMYAIKNYLLAEWETALIEWDIMISNIINRLWNLYVKEVDRYIVLNTIASLLNMEVRSFELLSPEQEYLDINKIPYEVNLDWESYILMTKDYKKWTYNLIHPTPKTNFWKNISVVKKEELEEMVYNYRISINWMILLPKKEIVEKWDKELSIDDFNELDSYSREAVRRGMWDWKKLHKFMTHWEFYSSIMRLIKKRKFK